MKKLWQAMLIGCDKRKQCYGNYFTFADDGTCRSCALAAAYEGTYNAIEEDGDKVLVALEQEYPVLDWEETDCPECHCSRGDRSHVIIHLNDDHHWTRERIALEYIKPKEELLNGGEDE